MLLMPINDPLKNNNPIKTTFYCFKYNGMCMVLMLFLDFNEHTVSHPTLYFPTQNIGYVMKMMKIFLKVIRTQFRNNPNQKRVRSVFKTFFLFSLHHSKSLMNPHKIIPPLKPFERKQMYFSK